MTNQYPWNRGRNTSDEIADEDDPRYETPGGAANKIEQALEDAKEYTDAELITYVAQTVNLADDAVTRPKIAPGAVGATELDPSLLDYTTDIAVANKFNEVDAQLADITQDTNVTVTVGSGGDYATINAALAFLSRKTLKYTSSGLKAEIKLLSGFAMAEQVILNGLDLGWITITSEDAVVTITRSALTQLLVIPAFGGSAAVNSYPAFGGINNAVLPIINALFDMDTSGTASARSGFFAGNGAQITVEQGKGCTHAGGQGMYAVQGGKISAGGANVSGAGANAISCFRGGHVVARDADLSNSGGYGIYADNISFVDASGADITYAVQAAVWSSGGSMVGCNFANLSNAGGNGITADNCSSVDAHGATINNVGQRGVYCAGAHVSVKDASILNAGTEGIYCTGKGDVDAGSAVLTGAVSRGIYALYGGMVNANSANGQRGASPSSDDIRVANGGIIIAINATGGLSKPVNTVTANGLIIGADSVEQITATLQNGWGGTLYYGKNGLGQVWIRGTITAGTVTAGTTVSALPGGYRPVTAPLPMLVYANNAAIAGFVISTAGSMSIRTDLITAGMSVDINITFQT